MIRVLHLIQEVSMGGACRALLATAKYSAEAGGFEHAVASLAPVQAKAADLARTYGIRVIAGYERVTLFAEIEKADILLIHWWNHPDMMRFLAEPLPPCRLAIFYHVGGNTIPHVITRELIDFCDMNIPCSPYSYLEQEVFRKLDPDLRLEKVRMVYGAADFARVESVRPKPHTGCNVGYVGTVDFVKMHRYYVRMSLLAASPEIRFMVCGSGGAVEALSAEAQASGLGGRFHFFGYVDDIRPVLEVLDIYGYPLCEDTYAASELNLQEVMYAGIPPVAFPYGGVKCLVMHDFTGLIVHSEREYAEAVEYLYRNPVERKRLGANAALYARQIFGARNAAQKLNDAYSRMVLKPKRSRSAWGSTCYGDKPASTGSEILLRSLGAFSGSFSRSRRPLTPEQALTADREISNCTQLAFHSGIEAYQQAYPHDPWLHFWSALVAARQGRHDRAILEFTEAIRLEFPDLRIYWHLSRSAAALGSGDLAEKMLSLLRVRNAALCNALEAANANAP